MIKKYTLLILTLLFIVGCSITPESDNFPELNSSISKIDSPSNITLKNNHLENTIQLNWDNVDNATFYIVEYQSALDYLTGKDMKSYITNTNSFSFTPLSNSDTRYLFRVKAVLNSNSKRIESSYTPLVEGVIINDFSVNTVIQDKVLSFYSTHGKVNSVLTSESLINKVIIYYEGNYVDSDIPADSVEVKSGEVILGSSENRDYTAALYIDNVLISKKLVNVVTDVDYVPQGLKSFSAVNNLVEGIKLNLISPGVNKGVENVGIKFLIERKSVDGEWIALTDNEGNNLYLVPEEGTDIYSEIKLTYIDETALANTEYKYRARTYYSFENDQLFGEESKTVKETDYAYRADTEVKSFTVTSELPVEKKDNNDGTVSYEVNLSWEPYHMIPTGYEYYITRIFIDQMETGAENSQASVLNIYRGPENSYTDVITLSSTERNDHQFIYKIQYALSNGGEPIGNEIIALDKNGNEASIKTEGLELVNIIKDNTFSVTNANSSLAGRIKLSWEYDLDSINNALNFNPDNVVIHIYRSELMSADYSSLGTVNYDVKEFIDLDVVDGTEYSYRIRAEYIDKEPSNQNDDDIYVGYYSLSDAAIGGTLNAVDGVSATLNKFNDKVEVNWSSVENASGYNIYADGVKVHTVGSDVLSYDYTDMNHAGRIIDFTVTASDKDGNETGFSIAAKGAILGATKVNVQNGAKDITLTWNEVENASRYEVKVYNSNSLDSAIYTSSVNAGEELRYVLSSDDPLVLNQDIDYPLSRPYYFTVVPIVDGVKPDSTAITMTEGSWVLPPTGITATKADYRDMVKIKWNSSGADEYNIYYRSIGDIEWNQLRCVSITEIRHLDTIGKFEYSISSVVDGKEGPIQTFFNGDDNIGYPLMTPRSLYAEDTGNGLFKISFNEVDTVTGYEVQVNNTKYIISSDQVESASASVSNPAAGTILKDGSKITAYVNRADAIDSVKATVHVKALNSNAPLDTNNSSFANSYSFRYVSLYDYEVVNILIKQLNPVVSAVDSKFNSDWWQQSRVEYHYSDNVYAASCKGSSGFGTYNPKENGFIQLSEYVSESYIVNGTLECRVEADQWSGYLDTTESDALQRVNGSIVITLPYEYGRRTVTFNDYNINNGNGNTGSGGSISVGSNTIDLSKITQKLL